MLARNNSAVQFIDKFYSVTCANGSKMESCGSVSLEIELGGIISRQSFIMVNNLFPRVFIGIKTMKNMKIEPTQTKNALQSTKKSAFYFRYTIY